MRAGSGAATRLRLPERRRRNRRVLIVAALLILVAWGLTKLAGPASRTLGATPLFQAGRIEIAGLTYLTRDEVRSAIAVREGESLFRVSPAEIIRALTRNPRIESASVRLLPAAIRVTVRERRPYVLLNAGMLLEVDSAGVILPPLPRGLIADRPVVTGIPVPTRAPGARVLTARFSEVLRLVSRLEAPEVGLLPEISEIVATDPRWLVLRTSRDQIPIFIDPGRATRRSLEALAATLRDLRERDRRVLGVDARYRGQVIVRCAPDSLDQEPATRDKV